MGLILAGVVLVLTLVLSFICFFAEAMTDTTGLRGAPMTTSIFYTGMVLTGVLVVSHYIGW